jgi:xeroderma pigmentosum group C-complementing protein
MLQVTESGHTELFGMWQTQPWAPPAARDGIVPKNERGNVEVPPFAKELPAGTTHLDMLHVFAACKRLGVDYAAALVGFEPGRGGMLPKIQGVVVCSEVVDAVRATAEEIQSVREEAAHSKRCDHILARALSLRGYCSTTVCAVGVSAHA